MDENNNNDNKVANQVKQAAKNAAKKAGQSVGKKILAWAWPYIGMLVIILLVLGFINYVFYLIRSAFTDTFDISSADNTESVQVSEVESIIEISNGQYKIKEEFSNKILERLEELYVNNELMYFEEDLNESAHEEITQDAVDEVTIEDLEKNTIHKYLKASLATMLPDNGLSGNDVEGKVKIKRTLPNNETQDGEVRDEYLTFIEYDTFMNGFRTNPSTLLGNFTINPEDFKLCIVVEKSSTTYYDYDGNVIDDMTNGVEYDVKDIDYLSYIDKYATPFNYFISMHLISQDKDFMEDLLDMVNGEGEFERIDPIILTYVESRLSSTEEITYYGDMDVRRTTVTKNLTTGHITYEPWPAEVWDYDSGVITNDNIRDYLEPDPTYQRRVTISCSGSWSVTKADTWLIQVEKEIVSTPNPNEGNSTTDNIPTIEGTYWDGPIQEYENKQVFDRFFPYYHITQTTTLSYAGTSYRTADETKEMKVDEFVEFIQENYSNVENNLETAPSTLFYFLQQSESTQNLEKIMRYVIYKLSGVFYGVDADDLEYLFTDFSYISSYNLLREYIRSMEGRPPRNEDGTMYVIFDDGFGNPTVGYGVLVSDIEHVFIEAGYSTEIGAEIDIEFVDELENQELYNKIDEVQAKLSGIQLKGYQLNALVSRAYNMGTSGAMDGETYGYVYSELNFVESYEAYWDQENDDKFEEKITEGDYTHRLYTEYMQYVVYSNGELAPGLITRRKSEWTLFQTGYYDTLGVWHPEGDVPNEIQARIADVAVNYASYGIVPVAGYCHGWVCDVYGVSGATGLGCCAAYAGSIYGVSNNFDFIPIGACVYAGSTPGNTFGHVGIYIGDGQIIHNLSGNVLIWSVSTWVNWASTACWGWASSEPLNDNFPISETPLIECYHRHSR